MPRLNKIDDILFPVEIHPVFVSVANNGRELRLAVPEKKAIVNANSKRVLGIVSRSYRLVTNREALEMASECCRALFPETTPGEWDASATDAPSTGGHCHIDLRHNSTALDFSVLPPTERPDVFGPFIRVTNSYNGLRALAFDIGFYRKVCKNGMIVPNTIIRFEFVHSRRAIGEHIRFEVAHDRLAKMKVSFGSLIKNLRECSVTKPYFDLLVRKVLALRPPEGQRMSKMVADDWCRLGEHLTEMEGRYMTDLGENAYAVLNAVTEFASHPPDNACVHRDRHSLQRLAGSWLNDFSKECKALGFDMSNYLDRPRELPAVARPQVQAAKRLAVTG